MNKSVKVPAFRAVCKLSTLLLLATTACRSAYVNEHEAPKSVGKHAVAR